ncbi:hypothetical protein AKJ09_09980 [Labilithrix luteola]|uniref:Carboxypeptidase regulatory-like domain-containing protein n=1 Tax=Labilithrix luteola TaxID=1391654 RepID=A0A0K1QCD6_9BACT|nr:hypothetical protein [Labilithrix luteola]AKV03317.1 hypothetical protein AKJ09_09980 [Labilithrix luteola]
MIVAGAAVVALGCGGTVSEEESPAPLVEVHGTVTLKDGDCMPGVPPPPCSKHPISARVDVYEPVVSLTRSESIRDGAPAVASFRTVSSDAQGRFSVMLPAGRYTILATYEQWRFPRPASPDGEWAPVSVEPNAPAELDLLLDLSSD